MSELFRKSFLASMSALALAACTQQAAPVVNGYDAQGVRLADYPSASVRQAMAQKQTTQVAARSSTVAPVMQEEDLGRIEPAAGERTSTRAVSQAVFAPVEVSGNGSYTVQERDTLYKIARAHNVTARDLMAENGLASTADVEPGMVLKIPAHGVVMAENTAAPKPSALGAVDRAEAALAKLEGKREAEAPRVAAISPEHENQLEKRVAMIEPAAGTLPQTSLTADSSEPKFVTHQVAAGETVYRISKQYNASVIDIMAANDFQTPQDLKAGMMVKVPLPGAGDVAPVAMETTTPEVATGTVTTVKITEKVTVQPANSADAAKLAAAAARASEVAAQAEETQVSLMQKGRIDPTAAKAKGLAWPVKGKIIRKYGEQGQGVAHTGINIAVPMNTPVVAAESGSVLYAGSGLKTYGNLVLIRHVDGMVTAYGHNGKLLVSKGEKVKKGQVVALSGNSGNVSEPQVHFEIRKQAKAVDPLRVLASR